MTYVAARHGDACQAGKSDVRFPRRGWHRVYRWRLISCRRLCSTPGSYKIFTHACRKDTCFNNYPDSGRTWHFAH